MPWLVSQQCLSRGCMRVVMYFIPEDTCTHLTRRGEEHVMNSVITADIAEAHTGMDLWRMVGRVVAVCAVPSAPEPAPPGAAPRWTPFMSAML